MAPVRILKWIVFLLALPLTLAAQKDVPVVINLANPSFEGNPSEGKTPAGWIDCGFPEESPPDIQPGQFKVTTPASNGTTYMGLVVRDNETYEAVAQRLSQPLEINQCYEFSLDLCRSELYMSLSRTNGSSANYVTPAKIRIWGGNGYCDRGARAEMLFETPLITNFRWLTYNFRLSPTKGSYSFITIEAYYKQPILFPFNGNVLVDNASPIRKVTCGMDKMPEMKEKPKPTPPVVSKGQAKPATPKPKPLPPAAAPQLVKMERPNMKRGKVFRLEKVYFDANKVDIRTESEPELNELYNFLRDNPDVAVEVGGHTNNSMWPNEEFAIQLSTNRAKSVADWLMNKGISADRVQFKGYGWTHPVQPNTTEAGKKKNQRVEVTILKIDD
jgi:outer membrane protein OmpA-like peptidoglycan-associated protein